MFTKNCFGIKNKAVFLWRKLKKRDPFDDKILKRLNFYLEFVLVEHKIILYLYNVIHTVYRFIDLFFIRYIRKCYLKMINSLVILIKLSNYSIKGSCSNNTK